MSKEIYWLIFITNLNILFAMTELLSNIYISSVYQEILKVFKKVKRNIFIHITFILFLFNNRTNKLVVVLKSLKTLFTNIFANKY